MLASLLVAIAALVPRGDLRAQTSADTGRAISGLVIDATTGAPLGGSIIMLSTGSALVRTTVTSATGAYEFSNLLDQPYRLVVRRLGYAPASIDVRFGEMSRSSLSVGLVVIPVRLLPLEIRATSAYASPHNSADAVADVDTRRAGALARQADFLSTDARELTTPDIAESATLGGSDIFRAMRAMPGVAPFDDWSAKLWVRGNRWDHDRVYYDGLPLFDPLQALGRGSGVLADAVSGLVLHPGVRPIDLGGEGASRIDLHSRAATDSGWQGSTQLSLFGASGVLEHQRRDSAAGFVATGQHSLSDWMRRAVWPGTSNDDSFDDTQLSARGDVVVRPGQRLETSALYQGDARVSRMRSGTDDRQSWGNAVGRATYDIAVGNWVAAHTVGFSHFSSSIERSAVSAVSDGSGSVFEQSTSIPVRSSVDYAMLSGRLTPKGGALRGLTLGYDAISQRSSMSGMRHDIYWGDLSLDQFARADALSYGSTWAQYETDAGERVRVDAGVRADVRDAAREAFRPSGTLQTRIALTPTMSASIGVGRTQQYVQAIDLPIVARGATTPSLWLTVSDDVPAMAIDNAMTGVEQWIGRNVLVAANAYWRRTYGAITADPAPGPLAGRPLFVASSEEAHGIELSARKMAGRTVASIAYSYGDATTQVGSLAYPSPASRAHVFDATVSHHLQRLTLTGAFTATSGARYTRTLIPAGTTAEFTRLAPNGATLPAYASLDLFANYATTVAARRVVAFAGLQNALGRRNATWYQLSEGCGASESPASLPAACRSSDLIDAPVRFAPTLGLRMVF